MIRSYYYYFSILIPLPSPSALHARQSTFCHFIVPSEWLSNNWAAGPVSAFSRLQQSGSRRFNGCFHWQRHKFIRAIHLRLPAHTAEQDMVVWWVLMVGAYLRYARADIIITECRKTICQCGNKTAIEQQQQRKCFAPRFNFSSLSGLTLIHWMNTENTVQNGEQIKCCVLRVCLHARK